MSERLLISKLKRTSATAAELYAPKHKYPDLKLFDLGELQAVGLDPESLPIGEERPARFYAIWQESERGKTNKAGNVYRDVVGLEPLAGPATVASTDNTAILGELRAIRALLIVIAEAQGLQVPEVAEDPEPENGNGNGGDQDPGELDRAFPRYQDGRPVSDNAAEVAAYNAHVDATGQAPASVEALRTWTKAHNGKR